MEQRVGGFSQDVDASCAIDGDVIDRIQCHACFDNAVSDGFCRHPGPMFDSAEPLLLSRRHNVAVAHDAGRCISVIGIEAQNGHHAVSRHVAMTKTPFPDRRAASQPDFECKSEILFMADSGGAVRAPASPWCRRRAAQIRSGLAKRPRRRGLTRSRNGRCAVCCH